MLIEADLGYQIDNMEGIAVHRNARGETVLTLVSDDNFSAAPAQPAAAVRAGRGVSTGPSTSAPGLMAASGRRRMRMPTPRGRRKAPLEQQQIAGRQQRAVADVEIVAALDGEARATSSPLSRNERGCRRHRGCAR